MAKNDQKINNPWTNMILRTSRNKLSRYHGTYIHTYIHTYIVYLKKMQLNNNLRS